jgi:E3 ubiquitin-protein ligase DOA10
VKKTFLNRRGISSVLSNLLLMVIAVAAMSIATTATYLITENLRENMSERFIIEDVWFKTGEIVVYLRNVGKMSIKVTTVYVNHTSQLFTPLEFKLEVGEHEWLSVIYDWDSDGTYHINIITSRGTKFADYYMSPPA